MESTTLSPAERVALLIKKLDVTTYQFGKATGISHQTLSNVLTGKNKPGLDTLQAIAAVYPAAAIFLLTGQGEPFPDGVRGAGQTTTNPDLDSATSTPVGPEPEGEAKMPATVKRRLETPMAVLRDVEEMTKDEQIAYYKALAEMAEEKAAAYEAAQRHETAVRLVRTAGGQSFTDASADAADTYEPAQMQVSYVAHDWQRFVAPKPAAYERRAVGFGAN